MFKKFISAIAMMAIMALLIPVSVFANSFSVLKNNVEDDFITLGEFAYYLVRVGGPLEYDSNNCALYLEDLNIDFNHKYARYMCMLGQNGVIVPAGESKKSYFADVDGDDDWKFKITAKNVIDNDVEDVAIIGVDVEKDDASSKKSNITNDFTTPVVIDEDDDGNLIVEIYFSFEKDDADLEVWIYEGPFTSGFEIIKLIDMPKGSFGSDSWITWNITMMEDYYSDQFDEGIYFYKIISETNEGYKDTETGMFAIGDVASSTASTQNSECDSYTGTGYIDEECVAIELAEPEITNVFLSKDSIDTDIGEFTTLAFTLSEESMVTVELYNGNSKEFTLIDEEILSKDDWHTVEWNGLIKYVPDKNSLVDMAINRVQAVKFIYDFFEIDFYKKLFISWNLFKDVPEEVWYAHYVNCLAAYNFFEYDDEVEFGGNFEPFKYMTKKTAYKWFKALGNLPLE